MDQLNGTLTDQIEQLNGYADDDEVWQDADTRTNFVGEPSDDDGELVLLGTVADYRAELQDLIDAR